MDTRLEVVGGYGVSVAECPATGVYQTVPVDNLILGAPRRWSQQGQHEDGLLQ